MAFPSRRISDGERKVGLPPPQCHCTTLRSTLMRALIRSISFSRRSRYREAISCCVVITVVQPQYQQSDSQNGRWKYSDKPRLASWLFTIFHATSLQATCSENCGAGGYDV